MLEILGFGSISKVLGDPFPLGGYSGYEIGLSYELIPTQNISALGEISSARKQNETSYQILTLGKGLFHNFDVYFQAAPFGQTENISQYGGQLRWGFYQSEKFPLYASFILHGTSTQFNNVFSANTQGLDLVAGFHVDDVTVYFGAGSVKAQGLFMGGNPGITDQKDPNLTPDPSYPGTVLKQGVQESLTQTHYLAGLNLKFSQVFIAFQLDRASYITYSTKLGFRF